MVIKMKNGSMQVKMHDNHSVKLITPENNKELFRHCAGGHGAVSPGRFERMVKPLLLAHGVLEIKIV